ncbi:MAG: hypothetical protein MUP48_03565, partial [Wolbachia endosymbiont of Homalodisca vitripennis]|nr:hypothetical protein [Wolbachia endosymbiont of Homalodisca vitripennis]MCJ7475729.1 hypothetical protein [Wolbachia endosymbiont of Homalodisca vitripennis]
PYFYPFTFLLGSTIFFWSSLWGALYLDGIIPVLLIRVPFLVIPVWDPDCKWVRYRWLTYKNYFRIFSISL